MPPPPLSSTLKPFPNPSRRNPLSPTLSTSATFAESRATLPLYQRILYPANGSPPTPPRILHSPSHTILDPLILDLIALALRAFVTPWYNGGISRDPDKDFLQAVTAVLVHVIQALEVRLATVDWTELVARDLPALVENHYRDWDLAQDKTGGGGGGNRPSAHNLSSEEMFHQLQPHVAISLVDGTPRVDPVYLRTLVDHLLRLLLPPEDYRAETERAIVREVLVGVVFGSVFGKVAQPWFLYGVISRILEGRELAKSAEQKGGGGSLVPDPNPSVLDQILSTVIRLPETIASTVGSISKLLFLAKSTDLPSHYADSPPLYSNLLSLSLAILPSSTTLSQLLQLISLPLSLCSRSLDALLYQTVTTRLTTEQTMKTVLEGTTRGMFPNDGWPAPKEPDPDEIGQRELEQRCREAIAKLLPDKGAELFYLNEGDENGFDSTSEETPRVRLARHLIRPFSSHVANVHLFVLVVDLTVGKLFPELVKNPEE